MSVEQGGTGLFYKARIDWKEAQKDAENLKKVLADLKIAGSDATKGGYDKKPLSEYQSELIKIKREKQEQARADREASLATQTALKEEARLRREALAASKTTTVKGGSVTSISNSQAEIDAYNSTASGSKAVTAALNEQDIAQARVASSAAAVITTTNQSTTATKSNLLTKIQANKLLFEEKYIQAQATRELKNNIREQLNAKGSLEQRRAALIRLQTAYDRLSASERSSASGQRLGGIVTRVTDQVKGLESATGRSQRKVGEYTNAIAAGFGNVYSKIRLVANILPGLGISGVILLALAPLGMLIDKLDIFKSSLEKLNAPQKALNSSYQESAGLLAKEGAETTLLVNKIKDQTRSVSERQGLLNDFINKNPAVLGALNLQNIATEKGTAIINDYIEALRRKIEMQSLEKGYAEALEKRADIDSGKEDTGLGWMGKTLITANKVLAGFRGESIAEAIDKANARFKNQALIAQDAVVKGYEERIKKTVEGEAKLTKVQDTSLSAAEAKLSQVNERLRNLQKGESDKTLKQQKTQLEKEIKERTKLLGLDTNTSAGKAEVRAQESALKRQRSLQAEIDNVKKKGLASQEEIDKQEIKNIEIKYDTLRKKAIAFNTNKDSKGLKVSLNGIASAETIEKKEVTDKSSAKTLKDEMDIQAKYYSEYENLKSKIGEEKARERYAKLIDVDKTYSDKLNEQQAKYANNPFAMKLLSEEATAAGLAIQKIDDERYATALQAAMTHAQALQAIDTEYNENVKALGKDATAEQLDNLKRQKQEAIRNANETSADLKSGYSELMQDYDKLTRQEILKRLQLVKASYQQQYKDGLLTAEQLADKVGGINENIDKLNGNNSFKNITESIKRYRDQVDLLGKDSEGARQAQIDMFAAIAQGAADAIDVINEVSASLEQLGIGGEGLQKAFKNVTGAIDGIGKIGRGLVTGNPVDVVTGSIKLLTNAIDLFNTKDKKLEKQINAYKLQLDSLSAAYTKLDRAVNNSVGESYYTDSQKQIDNLIQQQRAITSMRDAEAKKKKSDAGKISEYNNQLAEIPNKIEDIQKAIAENLIQTNFSQLSQNLADALADAFASGEDSAKAFDDVFRNVINNAVKNSLKLKILEPIVSQFTNELTAYAKNNKNSVIGFDFDKWKDQLKEAGEQFNSGLKGSQEFLKDIGLDTPDPVGNKNTLSGAIKNASQESIDLLAGQTGGMRLAQLQTNALLVPIGKGIGDLSLIVQSTFEYTVRIEQNTANTVVELKNAVGELKSMNSKIGGTNAVLLANGRV